MYSRLSGSSQVPFLQSTPIMKHIHFLSCLYLSLIFSLPTQCFSAEEKKLPNIVFFFADDLGYADLACTGHPYAKTPALDKLASQGTRFTQHYVTGVTCCPSRTGVMTSRHPASYEKYPSEFGFSGQTTITDLLKARGYRTGHFGKWHIGLESEVVPGTYGIDDIIIKGKSKEDPGRDDELVTDAINFITKNASGPFYVNIWGHSTHFPVEENPTLVKEFGDFNFSRNDFLDTIQGKFDESEKLDANLKDSMHQYLADVYSIDKNIDRIMQTLDKLGIAENTIVVFSSDHGAAPVSLAKGVRQYSDNMLGYGGPLKGGKHTQFEGGVRVPFIIRWPGHVPAGRVDTESVNSFMDWLPTLCAITGIEKLPVGIEGENISESWFGKVHQRATPLFWKASANGKKVAISLRDGKWKFHLNATEPTLYDLSTDEGERNNLAGQYPDEVKRLTQLAENWRKTLPQEYLKENPLAKGQKKKKDDD